MNNNQILHGKMPPNSKDIEGAILGAILIEKDAILAVYEIIESESFYCPKNAIIYQAMIKLNNSSNPIDMLTVHDQLKKDGNIDIIGGISYINELTNMVASSANIVFHALVVQQKYIQRKHIEICNDIIKEMNEDIEDVFAVSEKHTSRLLSLTNISLSNIKSVREIQLNINKSIILNQPLAKSFPIGFNGIEFMSKTFNVVAGYPGTGKTAFMLTACRNVAEMNIAVGILTIEMENGMLVARMIQTQTSISAKKIILNELTDKEREVILNCKPMPDNMYTDDSSYITNKNILSKIKSFILKYDVKLLWIDFIQLIQMVDQKKLEVKMIEELTRDLQQLAKDLDRCIIGLSQLSKTANGEKPTMNNIRNGGAEQAASDILILFDENHKKNDGVKWNDIQENRGKIEVIYAKGRYSEVGNSYIYFDKPYQKMSDWNIHSYSQEMVEIGIPKLDIF